MPRCYGNPTFTLMIELLPNAPLQCDRRLQHDRARIPALQYLPGDRECAGWFATAHFAGGNLAVTLFDPNSVIQSQITYAGVNAHAFGFYLCEPGRDVLLRGLAQWRFPAPPDLHGYRQQFR